ncbi:DUF2268 domain-containing protein [Flavobacterium salilacus subsp. salilacus]|uniref:DUF2268 domain-containing putative Zn-dependent protease n=1 Tax=Flavobacterium TaxID=237 RepID=UPI001074D675|nr:MULTISPECIES: DUF2268 domain-containing putative Zn-dependent protease [Flavobacterium]KAF2518723.1 DUF2268 domain-containing protein [Flavobacterium salilacus subsp. salilacus]MBE1613689.1 hypothetical protein [Flavobacterium sp. SaA2.13]
MKILFLFIIICVTLSCQNKKQKEEIPLTLEKQLEQLPDSMKIEDIVIYNTFKHQILAHKNNEYDSLLIANKVYKPHQTLWDNCYGMIFGEENATKFNNPEGMIQWNKTLYPDNRIFFDRQAETLLSLNIDSLFQTNLKHFNNLVPYKISSRISIAFVPFQGIGFGGCSSDQFVYELNNPEFDIKYSMEKGIPHELNHLAYEPFRYKDPYTQTALAQTIDEGFACYFTRVFFNLELSPEEAVEDMSEKDWNWYMQHEKEIFTKCKPYFYDESGDNPLLRNDQYKIFSDAPRSLNYWLGYRIIEFYVKKNGTDSWKEIYTMPIEQVYKDSGYEGYINTL